MKNENGMKENFYSLLLFHLILLFVYVIFHTRNNTNALAKDETRLKGGLKIDNEKHENY